MHNYCIDFDSWISRSGRTERQVAESQSSSTPPPQVVRVPSKRHERRVSAENKPGGKFSNKLFP